MISNLGQFISVENGISTFPPNTQQFTSYIQRVTSLLEGLSKDPHSITPEFANVDEKFLEFTGTSIDEVGTLAVQEGFVEFLKRTPSMDISRDTFNGWISLLQEFSPRMVGADSVNVEFLTTIFELYQQFGKTLAKS